jgi:hypothetical protein
MVTGLRAHLDRVNLQGGTTLLDLVYIGLTILFFVIAIGYVRGCEKLR